MQHNDPRHLPLPDAAELAAWQVMRRNGDIVPFQPEKIRIALSKAFHAVEGAQSAASPRVHELITTLTANVVHAITRRLPDGGTVHIENIQDQVELALMRAGSHEVARAYVLYRERHAAERAAHAEAPAAQQAAAGIQFVDEHGVRQPLREDALRARILPACEGLPAADAERLLQQVLPNLYDGIPLTEVEQALILAARGLIEVDPDYDRAAARLLLQRLAREALGRVCLPADFPAAQADYFPRYIQQGIEAGLLDPRLGEFDLPRLAQTLHCAHDEQFTFLGLQTLYDRYFLHIEGRRIELPQIFFMRVAMGLALNEIDREARAEEFYALLASFHFMSSTPTLFNSGTRFSQLSSCYLTTVRDDLDSIFQAIKENALLQKYAGGLGNDWTPIRALGSHIRGTNGESQGVIPFLKVVNDTAVAVNQGGKRKGAVCAFLETWHLDIEDFLELRKNTGDERRRTHDMNTANWVPDLFMRRVFANEEWTLFSPNDVPHLHDLYGKEFDTAYVACEARAERGEIKLFRKIPAVQLWRKMLTMLFETGHPWITFKDPCNLRSPQQHVGVVHSSNLCTEITLNTSDDETAVCNLGSVNLVAHLKDGALDTDKLARTIRTAVRMLDNVIDINYYATPKARRANLRHRAIGLGMMGFSDCLHALKIPYASPDAVEFADQSAELLCWHAYWASAELAAERGSYASYDGSLWSRGELPPDTLDRLASARDAEHLQIDRSARLDWNALREHIARHGMRNSNCIAIAPTATIANIVGVSASIEPDYQNLYVKSNLSGEFTITNPWLVRELKALDLWDEVMVADLKYFDGSLANIERIPEELRRRYATAFEIDPRWLIEAAARRQKWIDQAQSLNLYLAEASGRKLDELYRLAWTRGLKTTYYLRTLGASQAEKTSTPVAAAAAAAPKFCSIDNPDCEACQ